MTLHLLRLGLSGHSHASVFALCNSGLSGPPPVVWRRIDSDAIRRRLHDTNLLLLRQIGTVETSLEFRAALLQRGKMTGCGAQLLSRAASSLGPLDRFLRVGLPRCGMDGNFQLNQIQVQNASASQSWLRHCSFGACGILMFLREAKMNVSAVPEAGASRCSSNV